MPSRNFVVDVMMSRAIPLFILHDPHNLKPNCKPAWLGPGKLGKMRPDVESWAYANPLIGTGPRRRRCSYNKRRPAFYNTGCDMSARGPAHGPPATADLASGEAIG
jgi:hypothetical protein